MKIIRPKNSKWIADDELRKFNSKRVLDYPVEKFETFEDWFYFVHIDPYQRFWHTLGMFVGTFFFFMLFYSWSALSFVYYPLGVFFFYVLGIISHLYYDGGNGKSDWRFFHRSTSVVIKVNTLTFFGLYPLSLAKFIKKYPFVLEAYDLEITEKPSIWDNFIKDEVNS